MGDEIYNYSRTNAAGNIGVPGVDQIMKTVIGLGQLGIGLTSDSTENLENMNAIERQAYENKKTALWNFNNITKPVFQMEAEEWNRRFAAQNAYNDPSAQIQRMREAGLNPALLQGETGQVDAGNPTVNEAASSFADSPNIAQIRNANAQSDLAQQQAISTTIDNITKPILNWGKIRLQNVEIDVQKSQKGLNDAQADQAKARLKEIEESAKLINQQWENAKKTNELLHNQVRLVMAQAMTGEIEANRLLYQKDIEWNAMHSIDADGRIYYDPVNSFMAKYWKENRKWLIQSYIDEHNLKPFQALALKSSAYRDFTAGQVNSFTVPILKLDAGIKAMDFQLGADTFEERKEKILGTLRWQNGQLQLKSSTQSIDFWSNKIGGWLHTALDAANTIADFNSFVPDRMMKKVGQFIGTISGNQGNTNNPAIPGNQSTGNDIWNMGNSMGYDLNYNNGW